MIILKSQVIIGELLKYSQKHGENSTKFTKLRKIAKNDTDRNPT